MALAAIMLLSTANSAKSQDIRSILSGIGKSVGNKDSGSSGLGDVLNVVGALVGGKVEYKDMVGVWSYSSPAISFQSDNVLQKAGGAAASTMLENKIKPYYQRAGLTNLKMEFKSDSTFVATAGKFKAQGKITSLGDGAFVFNFKAFGSVPSGKLNAYAEKSGSNLLLTFDASKLVNLASKIATLSGNSTLKSASSLLNSYEGVNVGFEMKKTGEASAPEASSKSESGLGSLFKNKNNK